MGEDPNKEQAIQWPGSDHVERGGDFDNYISYLRMSGESTQGRARSSVTDDGDRSAHRTKPQMQFFERPSRAISIFCQCSLLGSAGQSQAQVLIAQHSCNG